MLGNLEVPLFMLSGTIPPSLYQCFSAIFQDCMLSSRLLRCRTTRTNIKYRVKQLKGICETEFVDRAIDVVRETLTKMSQSSGSTPRTIIYVREKCLADTIVKTINQWNLPHSHQAVAYYNGIALLSKHDGTPTGREIGKAEREARAKVLARMDAQTGDCNIIVATLALSTGAD